MRLDFHGLITSDVASFGILFHVVSTWKSSLRDSIYKPIYNKTIAPEEKKSELEGKKKKKKVEDKDEEKKLEKIRPTQAAANPRPHKLGGLSRAA